MDSPATKITLRLRPRPLVLGWKIASAMGLSRLAHWFYSQTYVTTQNGTWLVR